MIFEPHELSVTMRCSACGEEQHRDPFVVWHTDAETENLCFCLACCRRLRAGLAADLIQASAIADIRDLGFRDDTLARLGRNRSPLYIAAVRKCAARRAS